MRILVTGGCGYIGSTLVSYLLEAGHKVYVIDNLMYDNSYPLQLYLGHNNFAFTKADITTPSIIKHLIKKADIVIPLAALVGAPICDKQPRQATRVNYKSIGSLVKLLSPQQRILYPMTNSGYGHNTTKPCDEDDALVPLSLYATTKSKAEQIVLEHPNSVSFRLATVFGCSPRMRMDLMVNDFIQKIAYCKLKRTSIFNIYQPLFMRNFVHIRDVCRAFVFMGVNTLTGIFNVGHPDLNMSKLQLATTICKTLAVNPECIRSCDGEDPDKRNYIISNQKLLDTGFTFKYSLQVGIENVYQLITCIHPKTIRQMRNA